MENINAGAIGFVVIHNPADPDDVVGDPSIATPGQPVQDLPGGSFNGSPVRRICFPPPFDIPVLPVDLDRFLEAHPPRRPGPAAEEGRPGGHGGGHLGEDAHATDAGAAGEAEAAEQEEGTGRQALAIERGDLTIELDAELARIARFCLPFYRNPLPARVSRPSMSRSWRWLTASRVRLYWRIGSGVSGSSRATSMRARLRVNGVRSSWEALAMNRRWLSKERSRRSMPGGGDRPPATVTPGGHAPGGHG